MTEGEPAAIDDITYAGAEYERCIYCRRPFSAGWSGASKTRDHLIPKLLGNRGPENIVNACRECNSLKGGMTPAAIRALAESMLAPIARLRLIADRVENEMARRGLSL